MKSQKEIQEDGVVCVTVSIISDKFDSLTKTTDTANGEIDGRAREIDSRTNASAVKDQLDTVYAIKSKEELCVRSHPRLLFQVLGSVVIAMAQMGITFIIGFSGVTLPQLTKPDSDDIYLSPNDAALFGSMMNLGAAVGSILGVPFIARFGQRFSLLISLPVLLLSWLLQAFSHNIPLILVSRFFLGVMAGIVIPSSYTYAVEIVHKSHRGWVFSIILVTEQIGYVVLSYIASTSLSWRSISLICGFITNVPSFIGLLFFPNSPRWLVTRKRINDAEASLIFFRGVSFDVIPELKDIVEEVGEQQTTNNCNIFEQLCMLSKRHIFPKFSVLFFITLVATLNGSFIITSYMVPIFQSFSSEVDAYSSAIIYGTVRVIGTVLASTVIDRFERKNIIIITYILNAFSLAALGVYFYGEDQKWNLSSLGWLPLSSLVLYTFSLAACIPVLALLRGEMLSSTVRSAGYSVLITVMYSGGFIVTLVYPQMTEALGQYGSFWIYSVSCVVVSIFSYFAVPSISGRSLEEISHQPKRNPNSDNKAVLPD